MHERVEVLEIELHRARLNIRAQYHQMEAFIQGMNEQSQREVAHYARMEAHAQMMEAHNQKILEFA